MPYSIEVRPFLPLDLPLVHRLSPMSVSLDSLTALTQGNHMVENAVWSSLPLADLGTPTYVLRLGESGYVAQFRHKVGDQHAHIVFIAPTLSPEEDSLPWLRLIEALIAAAGKRGAVTLNAEVAETDPIFDLLRQAGFAVYARQTIWQRAPQPLRARLMPLLRPATEQDVLALQTLYLENVPRLLRQAYEPPEPRNALVFGRNGRLSAYIAAHEGKYGIYLDLIMNPDECQPRAVDLLADALSRLPRAERLPVYAHLYRHQEWLSSALERLNFVPIGSQALMVRHTARRCEQTVRLTQTVENISLALPRRHEFCYHPPALDHEKALNGTLHH
ncbi:MAG: hypothetical protein CUN49_14370 [Candidatus Thermofonsia Clade 1 bacterium]|uniref:N-acetyltransferase domain-containing protein n=1 Tax=Candidatus Thermofonsia Clade 1 bacterium TaxID=2364210 RepID=A0A2M8PYS6_9CHLR|nr:MAG: hypothetical protein CUN49_14370 [Candidatus Thermofonsia Clade 1 bacterium]PJF42690.1 MAG: hypothetical protein CUN50_03230 [Candidatus Thermofonsia Clade 1 bacterium]